MIGSRLIKSNDVAAGCEDIVDNYDPFGGSGIALYQLNGNANDESPNGYNGTWSGTEAYGTGVFGQAGVFDGTSSRISLPKIDALSADITVSGWVKWQGGTTTSRIRFAEINTGVIGNTNAGLMNILYRPSDGEWQARVGNGVDSNDSVTVLTHAYQLTNDTWYHICFTRNDSTNLTNFYVNGSAIDTEIVTASASYPTNSVGVIGAINRTTAPTYNWDGSIDQVRIFNTALDPLEVEALYTEELCICGGTVDTLDILGDNSCIATYQLDGNANDLSGNYSGTPTDVSYGVGEFDLAGVFNGSSSAIVVPHNSAFNTSNSFSISTWLNRTDNSERIVAYKGTGAGQAWFLNYSNTHGYYFYDYGTTSYVRTGTGVTSTGVWENVILTWDSVSKTPKIYINTIDQSNTQVIRDGSGTTTTADFNIGSAMSYTGMIAWNGSIDQVRIFNKALTPENVQTLYDETACTYTPKSNLILHLDANDSNSWTGSGSTWFDVSGNDYNADILTTVPSTGTVGSTTYLNLSTRDDYFKIPIATHGGALSPKSGNKLTYLYWMNLPSVATGVDGICVYHRTETAAGNNTSYSRYYKPSVEGHTPWFYDNAGTRDINPGYLAPSTQNKWMMVVLTMDYTTGLFGFHRYGDGMTTYHNYNMGTVNPYPTADSDIFLFNSNEPTYGGYGYVGEIKVFDKPLDEIEMGIEYNNGKIKYGIS